MLTREAAIERVRAFAAEVRQRQFPLRQAILFGSYARNEQHEWSDIDVALIADAFTGFGFDDVKLVSAVLGQKMYLELEPHTFNTAVYEAQTSPLAEEIKRTGIIVA